MLQFVVCWFICGHVELSSRCVCVSVCVCVFLADALLSVDIMMSSQLSLAANNFHYELITLHTVWRACVRTHT